MTPRFSVIKPDANVFRWHDEGRLLAVGVGWNDGDRILNRTKFFWTIGGFSVWRAFWRLSSRTIARRSV